MTRLKDIPQLQPDGRNLSSVMEAMREVVQTFRGYRGDKLDRALTLRDLDVATARSVVGGGTIGGGSGGTIVLPGGGGGGGVTPDLTPPPTPTGLVLTAGLTSLFVGCDIPSYTQGHGHDRTVVYGAKWPTGDPEPTFSDAVELWQYQGPVSSYGSETGTRWCIWIKWRSMDGVLSADPAGGTNGVQATTLLVNSPDLAVNAIAAGSAYITDAKIAAVSASKLTVGDGTVGGNLKSSNYNAGVAGWLVTPSGYLEAQNAVLRGTVYASAGLIGGITIASNAIRAGQTAWNTGSGFFLRSDGAFSLGNSAGSHLRWDGVNITVVGGGVFSGALSAATGTFAGNLHGGQFTTGAYVAYTWPAAGLYGTYLGPGGLLMGNVNNGKYCSITADGDIYTPGFQVVGGALTVWTANVINTVHIAGQAVTIPSSSYVAAATTFSGGAEVTIGTLGFTSSGAPVHAHFNCYFTGDSNASSATIRLKRNGVTMQTQLVGIAGNSVAPVSAYSTAYAETPGAGFVTYSVTAQANADSGSAGTWTAAARSLFCLEMKR